MKIQRSKRGDASYPLLESAEPLEFGVIRLQFDDGYEAVLDLRENMKNQMWSDIQTEEDFFAVEIDEFGFHLSWPKAKGLVELPADGLRFDCERLGKAAR